MKSCGILLAFCCMFLIRGGNSCRQIEYLPCVKNKTFTGHVINTFQVLEPALLHCRMQCFLDNRCVSYNLGPLPEETLTCELNDFDHVIFPNDVVDKEGADYCPLKNPCSFSPCPFGKVCVPDFNLNTTNCFDGVWSSWGPWCKCPTTRSRVRVCCNPFTNTSATDCPGDSRESDDNQLHEKIPKDCLDASQCGCRISGVHSFPIGDNYTKLYCDQETDGGGWTVIQRRQDGSVDFFRGWQDYKDGFGDLYGEFWLGLDKIHQLTNLTRNILRVDLEDVYAEYDYFAVDDEANQYTLRIGSYVGGNASDSLAARHANAKFSTKDRDNDLNASGNCASLFKGAWWYTACHDSNLNALYLNGSHSTHANGINWESWKGHRYSAKTADMKIRPI